MHHGFQQYFMLKSNKQRYRFRRWAEIYIYAVVADAFLFLMAPFFSQWQEKAVCKLGLLGFFPLLIASLIIIIFIIFTLGQNRWRGLRTIHYSYPPIWIAILIGIGLFCGVWGIAIVVAGTVVLLFVLRYYSGQSAQVETTPLSNDTEENANPSLESIIGNFDELIEWVSDNDQPIADGKSDLFRHDIVASRMANRILESNGDAEFGAPTQALIGRFGSGKSSILNLVKNRIDELKKKDKQQRTEITDLSAWGYESTDALISSILTQLIRTVGKHANTLELVGLPAQYTYAIEKASGQFGALASLLQVPENPSERLQKIDRIAQAIGLRIVLWIEDLERFAGDSGEGDAEKNERLRPIRALLYELNNLTSVTVIIADTSLDTGFDLEKIARYIEHPPTLSPEIVWKTLRTFRRGCLDTNNFDFIDAASKEERKYFEAPDDDNEMWMFTDPHIFDNSQPNLAKSLALLLQNPRTLKSCLRTTYEIWEKLFGEIDFDEVLILSAIRNKYPKVFSLVDTNILSMRSGLKAPRNDKLQRDHPALEQFESLLLDERDLVRRNGIDRLLKWLFPGTFTEVGTAAIPKRPQSVSNSSNSVDYWKRYTEVPEISKDDSDQLFLRTIRNWKNGNSDECISQLMQDKFQPRFKQFRNLFSPEEMFRLLQETINQISKITPDGYEKEHKYALYTIIAMMNRFLLSESLKEQIASVIKQAIQNAIINNLSVVVDLELIFAPPDGGDYPRLISDESPKQIRELIEKHLVLDFREPNTGHLAEALGSNANSRILFWLTQRELSDKRVMTDWKQFRDILITETFEEPNIMLPQLMLYLLSFDLSFEVDRTTNSHEAKDIPRYDDELAKRFFGDRLSEVITLFKENGCPVRLDETDREMFITIQNVEIR